MKLTERDSNRDVRLVVVANSVTRNLRFHLVKMGIAHDAVPQERGEFFAFVVEIPLKKLLGSVGRMNYLHNRIVGMSLFWYPDDGSDPVLLKKEHFSELQKVVNDLDHEAVARGMDLQWGVTVDDRIPQEGRELAAA